MSEKVANRFCQGRVQNRAVRDKKKYKAQFLSENRQRKRAQIYVFGFIYTKWTCVTLS